MTDTPAADAAAPSFPMPLEAFLAGDHMSRADVLLVRGNTLFGKAIRFATRSPFSHAALVFLVPHREDGFERTFLIEAVPKGVSIAGLDETAKKGHAIAVLRLERPWFDKSVKALVRGRMLDFIKAGYDWRTVLGLAWSVVRGFAFGHANYAHSIRRSLRRAYRRHGLAPANFICSGLVQYGFLRTVLDLSETDGAVVPAEDLPVAVFNPDLAGHDPKAILRGSPDALAELLSTTPEDISRSPHLRWKYLILGGTVHAVGDRAAAVKLMGTPYSSP